MTTKKKLVVMDSSGHMLVEWETKDEQKEAKTEFNIRLRRGYIAYSTEADGSDPKMIRRFDKKAEQIIMSPVMAGG